MPIVWSTLQRLVAGDPRVLWINRPSDFARLREPLKTWDCVYSLFVYTSIGEEWPMVHIIETAQQVWTATDSPPYWTRQQRRRLDRDVDRFTRELHKGEDGKVLAGFELRPSSELLHIIEDLVREDPTTTH
jgi:hypothetical protein